MYSGRETALNGHLDIDLRAKKLEGGMPADDDVMAKGATGREEKNDEEKNDEEEAEECDEENKLLISYTARRQKKHEQTKVEMLDRFQVTTFSSFHLRFIVISS